MSQHALPTTAAPTAHEPAAARAAHPPSPPHPPSATLAAALEHRAPRTAFVDRLAMRAGLWLLLWASRPTHLSRAEAEARRERERLMQAHGDLRDSGPRHPFA